MSRLTPDNDAVSSNSSLTTLYPLPTEIIDRIFHHAQTTRHKPSLYRMMQVSRSTYTSCAPRLYWDLVLTKDNTENVFCGLGERFKGSPCPWGEGDAGYPVEEDQSLPYGLEPSVPSYVRKVGLLNRCYDLHLEDPEALLYLSEAISLHERGDYVPQILHNVERLVISGKIMSRIAILPDIWNPLLQSITDGAEPRDICVDISDVPVSTTKKAWKRLLQTPLGITKYTYGTLNIHTRKMPSLKGVAPATANVYYRPKEDGYDPVQQRAEVVKSLMEIMLEDRLEDEEENLHWADYHGLVFLQQGPDMTKDDINIEIFREAVSEMTPHQVIHNADVEVFRSKIGLYKDDGECCSACGMF
ncbi:hypothetical protein CI109_105478 [Kwoniella shandongensis]|uniref:Uncharacterized protein n=1 Tax=Kwoniella shandongensis TaxID=1734106 RepID=A0A5M6C2F7_9TREE|nr:uncharacterized protein CI109_002199 [Kwoniella shandongensis]KAA5529306.1 hypothetical protein CI109_002199 [Kwoniella shandongensis]